MTEQHWNQVDAARWAILIRDSADSTQVKAVIDAINGLTHARQANRAAVIVACAQIIGQNIQGESAVADEMRAAIITMIDGYALGMAASG